MLNKAQLMAEYGLSADLEEFVTGSNDLEMRQKAEKLHDMLPKKNMINTGLGEIDWNNVPEHMKEKLAREHAAIHRDQQGVEGILSQLEDRMPDEFSKIRALMADFRAKNDPNRELSDVELAKQTADREIAKRILKDRLVPIGEDRIWK